MYIFYSATILVGIMCVCISILILMIDRKKVDYIVERLDNKKEDLMEVINDAEQIVVEMNNFADYLFEKIDNKVSEIKPVPVAVESEVKSMPAAVGSEVKYIHSQPYYAAAYKSNTKAQKKETVGNKPQEKGKSIDIKVNDDELDYKEVYNISKDKVIPLNPRYRDAYALFEQGYSELEIAKRLNMGLGEIKLIIGVKR